MQKQKVIIEWIVLQKIKIERGLSLFGSIKQLAYLYFALTVLGTPLLANILLCLIAVSLFWIVGHYDISKLKIAQTENEMLIRKTNTYLDKKLRGR